jgi:MFS family permease
MNLAPAPVDVAVARSPYAKSIFAAAFLTDFGFGILLTAVPYLAISLGGTVLGLGILGASRAVVYALACPFVGALSDLAGRKTMALVSCVSVICGNLLLSQSTRLWHAFAGFMIIGVSLAFFWPLVLAWVGDVHSSRQLPRTTAVFNICWSSGMMIGTLVGGALFSLATFAPFVCAAGAALLAFAALSTLPDPVKKSVDASKATHKIKRPFHPTLIVAWINNFAVCFGLGVLQNVFPKQAHGFGLGAAVFGWLLFAMGLGRTAVFLGATFSSSMFPRRLVICVGLTLAILSLLVSMQSRNTAVLLVAFTINGLALGVTYYFSYLQSVVGVERRGKKTGMHEATLVGGIMMGSLLGGISAKAIGPEFPYLMGVIVLVGAIINQFIPCFADGLKERSNV